MSLPLAAAHMYMLEPGPDADSWSNKPEQWSNIRFDKVDMLFVSPFIVRSDGNDQLKAGRFELDDPAWRDQSKKQKGDLQLRLQHLIELARNKNSKIKILAQQFWGGNDLEDLKEDQLDTYAASVAAVVKQWGLDGYDLDYEWRPDSADSTGGNVIPGVTVILQKVRKQLDDLSRNLGRALYVTISPATSTYLNGTPRLAESVDFVNIQSYDGGRRDDNTVETYLAPEFGFKRSQLLWGILPENTRRSYTVPSSEDIYKGSGQPIAGIHNWRLNSHNQKYENEVQTVLFNTLHPELVTPGDADRAAVIEKWGYWDFWPMVERKELPRPIGDDNKPKETPPEEQW